MERKNIAERIKRTEEVALLGQLHSSTRKTGNKKNRQQRRHLVELHGPRAKRRSQSRLVSLGFHKKRSQLIELAQQTEGRGGTPTRLNKYAEIEAM
jgi:hypothetical protein